MTIQPIGLTECEEKSFPAEYVMIRFPGVFASREVPEPILILWLLF